MSSRSYIIGMALLAGIFHTAFAVAQCNARIALTKPDSRYLSNGDGTVTDTVTGLMWRQCSEGVTSQAVPCDSGSAVTYGWQQALQHVADVNAAHAEAQVGYSDWRLPDLKELKSLSELACFNPAINTTLFPNTPADFFWSATPVLSDDDYAWSVGFYYGGDRWGQKSDVRYVRLVRTAR